MAFRLETKMFICRANKSNMYNKDLTCRSCTPNAEEGVMGQVEDKDYIEFCPCLASLWAGLGPLTNQARV